MNDIWSKYDFTKIPFDSIIKFGQRSLLYRDLFCVSWLLGRFCNYNCSYCWPYARSDTKDHRSTQLCLDTMDEIKRQARERNYNSFHFSFSGGEPTLHPGYLDILSHYSNDLSNVNYQSIHMTTNLSPGMRWFEKYIKITEKLHRVSITASWHREQGIKQGNLELHKTRFADKLCYLQEHGIQLTINMVMVPEWFDMLWEDALYFHDREINVTLKPQSNSTANQIVDGYTEHQLARLHNGMPQREYTTIKSKIIRPKSKINMKPVGFNNEDNSEIPQIMQIEFIDDKGNKYYMDQAERFNAFNFNQFKGWICDSGYRSIIIREPCGSIKRSYSCQDEPLGNIETGFKLFKKPMPCITTKCISSADSKIPKRKNDE